MKYVAIVGVLLLAFMTGCGTKEKVELATTVINTPTIVCGTCAKTIEKAVNKVPGVKEVLVDTKLKTVKVTYENANATLDQLETAITGAGYDANGRKRDQAAYDKLDVCCKIDG